jgi:hypothetical protein
MSPVCTIQGGEAGPVFIQLLQGYPVLFYIVSPQFGDTLFDLYLSGMHILQRKISGSESAISEYRDFLFLKDQLIAVAGPAYRRCVSGTKNGQPFFSDHFIFHRIVFAPELGENSSDDRKANLALPHSG